MAPVTPVTTPLPLTPPATLRAPAPANAPEGGPSFGSVIGDALQKVDQLQQQANDATTQVATGQAPDLHDALIRVEEASLALQLALQVRNKVVESYQEIMRMPV